MKDDNTEIPEYENTVIYTLVSTNNAGDCGAMLDLMGNFQGKYFSDPKKGLIFDAIKAMTEKGLPVNSNSVCVYLNGNRKEAELESSEFMDVMRGIIRTNPPMALSGIDTYALELTEAYCKRQLLERSECIREDVYHADGRSAAELKALAVQRLEDTDDADLGTEEERIPATEAVQEFIREMKAGALNEAGIKTGFAGIDVKLKGLKGGQLILLAARPGMGKSALALNMAQNIAKACTGDKPVMFFSLEMPQREIVSRMVCTDARADLDHVMDSFDLTPAQTMRLTEAFGQYVEIDREKMAARHKLYFRFGDNLTPGRIMLEAQKLKRDQGIGCIFIDYLQYIQPDKKRDNRNIEVSDISHALKALAKRFDVPVIALSQLNRDIDSRADHVPQNSDLRDSGSLEQDADVIMFLNREAAYPQKKGRDGSVPYMSDEDKKKATLYITKNRNGQGGIVDLMYEGSQFRFYEPEQDRGYGDS